MVAPIGIRWWTCGFEEDHDLIHHIEAKLKNVLKNTNSLDHFVANSTKVVTNNLTNDIDVVILVESI